MTDAPERSSDTCYRHPKRESYVLCQRCGRTICPDCQTPAAVGVQCPECVKEGRASQPRVRRGSRIGRVFRPGDRTPVVTWSIVGVTIVVFIAQLLTGGPMGGPVTGYLAYWAPLSPEMPWTMLTYVLVHGGFWHIVLNMYSLIVVGPILELSLGRWRFLALYLIAAFGGAVAVLWLAPGSPVVGASGAIFGCFAALVVLQRGLGGNPTMLLVVIGINLVLGFVPGFNVSWQAHVGGLVAGAAVALVFFATRHRRRRGLQWGLLALVVAILLAATFARFALL